MNRTTWSGGCHCGAIRFEVTTEATVAYDCNCSICRMKGFVHLIVPEQDFTLLRGEESLSCYTFNTGTARHLFCRICGIASFYRPRSHPQGWDINVRCLDGDALSKFTLLPFNGQDWEGSVETIR